MIAWPWLVVALAAGVVVGWKLSVYSVKLWLGGDASADALEPMFKALEADGWKIEPPDPTPAEALTEALRKLPPSRGSQ